MDRPHRSNQPGGKRKRSSGFTLLEMVIALALMVILLGMIWNIIAIFNRSQSQGTRLAESSQLVRSLAQLLEDDLKAAIQDPIHPHRDSGGDDDIRRFGLSGSSRSLRIDVIEINPFAVPQTESRSARFGEIRSAEPRAAELKTVFYTFEPAQGLSRREIDFETPDLTAPGPEGSDLFAPEVVDCRFRYYNGTAWSDSWESLDRGGIPVAIEATLRTLPLAEANKRRRGGVDVNAEQTLASMPRTSVIVAYLPASPVRRFEQYQRKSPPKKEETSAFGALPIPQEIPPPPPPIQPQENVPPPTPEPATPQQVWIRGS